jgi:hypothetical protein
MENQTQDTTQETTNQAAAAPQLGVGDLKNLLGIVDIASRRGAFQANEMSSVGATFDRVNAFLNSLQADAAPADASQADASAPTADATQDAPAA